MSHESALLNDNRYKALGRDRNSWAQSLVAVVGNFSQSRKKLAGFTNVWSEMTVDTALGGSGHWRHHSIKRTSL